MLVPPQALSQFFPGLFGSGPPPAPPNAKSAWLREPMYTKSRPLTSVGLKAVWMGEGKRAHHRVCRYLASPDPFLDYVSCPKCNVSLGEDDVFWKSVYRKKK